MKSKSINKLQNIPFRASIIFALITTSKLREIFAKNKIFSEKIILYSIIVFLALIPLLFWGNNYIVGGDDTRAYYIFPNEFINNFVFKITPDNSLGALIGYYPKSFLAPFIYVIIFLKYIPVINIQMFLYGLNLSMGFLFFYLFLGVFEKEKTRLSFFTKITSSLFYILSTYITKTLFENQLIAMYLITAVPGSLFFFTQGFLKKKIHLTVISVVFFSIFSSTFVSLPWSLAAFIVLIPFFLYLASINPLRFTFYLLFSFGIFLLLNFYWIIYHIYSFESSPLQFYNSSQFQLENSKFIEIGAKIFTPLNAFLNERRANLLSEFSFLTFIKSIFFFVVLSAGIFFNNARNYQKTNYILSLSILTLSIFFFQPNFGDWSINFFILLNNNIPFFTIFRNMYDKFSFSLAFAYGFALFTSLSIVTSNTRNKKAPTLLLVALVLVIVINSKDFLFPDRKLINSDPIRVSGEFNSDFKNLLKTMSSLGASSRFLWLPLNYPGYIYIEDEKNTGHYYFGPSLLPVLINRSDYAGYLNFGTGFDPKAGDTIFMLIKEKKYDELGKVLKRLNVNYIIENKSYLPKNLSNFLYSENMLDIQGSEFRKYIRGKKIKDFGNRYSIYEINEKYKSNKIYLEDNVLIQKKSGNNIKISYEKKSDSEFYIKINNLKGKSSLILQDLYNKNWIISLENNKEKILFDRGMSKSANEYLANTWEIDSERIKEKYSKDLFQVNNDGSISMKLKIYLHQQVISKVANSISFITWVGIFAYIIAVSVYEFKKNKKNA